MRIKSSVTEVENSLTAPAYYVVASGIERPWTRSRSPRYGRMIAILSVLALLAVAMVFWFSQQTINPVGHRSGVIGNGFGLLPEQSDTAPPPPAVKPTELIPLSAVEARASNDKVPISTAPLIRALPFRYEGSVNDRDRARDCLAAAAWYEAGDNATGQSSVAQVVLNRARHPAFPSDICAVVFQGAERTTGCQFTFTCDGSMPPRKPNEAAWARAQAIADSALSGRVDARVGLATHYHTDWVLPYWSASLDKIAKIQTHLFFKWRGYWGTLGAFRFKGKVAESRIPQMTTLSPAHLPPPVATDEMLRLDGTLAEGEPHRKTDFSARAQNFPVEAAKGARDLKGNMVIGQSEDGRRFLVALNPRMDSHIYALTAMQLCRGKSECEVQGWIEGQTPDSFASTTPTETAAMRFRYQRSTTRGDQAKWDCKASPRPNADQCL